jgi:hypothetical protein
MLKCSNDKSTPPIFLVKFKWIKKYI